MSRSKQIFLQAAIQDSGSLQTGRSADHALTLTHVPVSSCCSASACYLDNAFSEEFLVRLEKLWVCLPVEEKATEVYADQLDGDEPNMKRNAPLSILGVAPFLRIILITTTRSSMCASTLTSLSEPQVR